jgi:hypothetical protein
LTVTICDQDASGARLCKRVRHLVHADVGSVGARGRVHDVLDARVGVALERLAAQVTEDDPSLVDDNAQVIARMQVADALADSTRIDIALGDGADARLTCQLAFRGEPRREPVSFAAEVAVDG